MVSIYLLRDLQASSHIPINYKLVKFSLIVIQAGPLYTKDCDQLPYSGAIENSTEVHKYTPIGEGWKHLHLWSLSI